VTVEPVWLTVEDVIRLNQDVVAETGEPHLIASLNGLESAVARPLMHFQYGPDETHDDLVLLGAKLCIGISESQAFQQGNKRTGLVAMMTFFNDNGYDIDSSAHRHVADMVLGSAHPDHALRLTDEEFAEYIDPYVIEGVHPDILAGLSGPLGERINSIRQAFSPADQDAATSLGMNVTRGIQVIAPVSNHSAAVFDGRDQDGKPD
jgi:death-on-curing protein